MKSKIILFSLLLVFSFCKKENNKITDPNHLILQNGTYVSIPLDKIATPVIGWSEFFVKLLHEVKYPALAREKEIQGKVHSYFIVNEQGIIDEIGLDSGIGYGCDEEVLRVINLFKNEPFYPAEMNGNPIKSKVLFPVSFKLE